MKNPSIQDFFVRGIPLSVSLEAIEKWDTLTEEQRAKLGFGPGYSPLAEFLEGKESATLLQLVTNDSNGELLE